MMNCFYEIITMETVKVLKIGNKISNEGMEELSNALIDNSTLTALDLCGDQGEESDEVFLQKAETLFYHFLNLQPMILLWREQEC